MNKKIQYTISGTVLHGKGYGKILGFPTANIDRRSYGRIMQKPRLGIWAGTVLYKNFLYKAAVVIGPMDGKGLPKIEAHMLDFSGNLYGKKIQISLFEFLRVFKKYRDEKHLQEQIAHDVAHVKKLIRI